MCILYPDVRAQTNPWFQTPTSICATLAFLLAGAWTSSPLSPGARRMPFSRTLSNRVLKSCLSCNDDVTSAQMIPQPALVSGLPPCVTSTITLLTT